ncbi:hypothetical protein BGX33_004339 [Mortierella sp. NVP41]|nr:hypothetical protein BGX33_004339 [Mortierella sp. NVP41]
MYDNAGLRIHDGDNTLMTEIDTFHANIKEYSFRNNGYAAIVNWHADIRDDSQGAFWSGCWDTTNSICGNTKKMKAKRDCDQALKSRIY